MCSGLSMWIDRVKPKEKYFTGYILWLGFFLNKSLSISDSQLMLEEFVES